MASALYSSFQVGCSNRGFRSSSAIPLSGICRANDGLFSLPTSAVRGGKKNKRCVVKIEAAKVPSGVVVPKEQPKFQAPFAGFTKTAEIWNSRACMMGLIGTFIVELILNKGILEMIGVEIGKGLDIPL